MDCSAADRLILTSAVLSAIGYVEMRCDPGHLRSSNYLGMMLYFIY
jgi:hypothetical protein